jgi:hypothetical protein
MAARRSLSALRGIIHVNRAAAPARRRAPPRPARARPLALRLEPRDPNAPQSHPCGKPLHRWPCRRVPGGYVAGVAAPEEAPLLRRWPRRRLG